MHISIRLAWAALGICFFATAPALAAKPPNIVFILADDKYQ